MIKMAPPGYLPEDAVRSIPHWAWDWRLVARSMPRARRFVLSSAASEELGRIIVATEDMILTNHQFAIPPYPVTYVEMDHRAFHLGLDRPVRGSKGEPDNRVGYLSIPDRVMVFAQGSGMSSGPGPLTYLRSNSHPLRGKIPAEDLQDNDWAELAFMLASSMHAMPSEEVRRSILDSWSVDIGLRTKWSVEAALSGAGDLRNFLAIMLLLNCPGKTILTSVAASSGINRGKRIAYAAHSVVELQLGKVKDYRRLFQSFVDRLGPRRHEVRGHFRHRGGRDGCLHNWPLIPTPSEWSDAPTWSCTSCGRLRSWVEHFERGDASRGFLTKEYAIEPQGEEP